MRKLEEGARECASPERKLEVNQRNKQAMNVDKNSRLAVSL
jgi:hypothetical protein